MGINEGMVTRILEEIYLSCLKELASKVRINMPPKENYQSNGFAGTERISMLIVHKNTFSQSHQKKKRSLVDNSFW